MPGTSQRRNSIKPTRNEESKIGVSDHSSNSDEASSAARDDADVFPGILTLLALTVMLIVEVGDSFS